MRILTPDNCYFLHFDDAGQFEFASSAEGKTVYIPNVDRYNPEANPDAADFLAQGYDLSDRPSTLTLQQAIEQKQAEITAAADAILSEAIEPYHAGERDAWALKRLAALRFLETGEIEPILQIEAESRQVPIAALAQRIIAKSEEYGNLQARVVGLREFHRSTVAKLQSVEDVMGYEWSIG